ncbi:3-deoxy-7-phosphoheptulonate synthase [Umezakia ovalisporum]|jgi:3-deoxy-7-phosphoheptulonate synthase|uniref:Phospho-2-dehydro-3-deoxyheptonate aldolase n=2 Tax=Umezakia ovalisporum TaxID=75695 RepID=A0AA43KDK3_9CYAN|nr:3-deoxy-7-phosphoheptulonate synthase [Umezakia ovalisporum]MBI1242953.1 3-deoxy-7-phosphoheptulonate synthase [Nostoc sp. RI_552]MDH6056738.1 3-deoxy-7-phosphoheptulonate synthase [Umezakia ovalisporum FSS-43]MDH6062669.1 3-deoxy-7-phosphoheptulonate synthase [Umezakia ovalisporum FSS-62]MDH6067823.1 3-deoxy-7-phosphoheptulonate synthase [Umezakia ovalisporum APH033B]MDH6072153.1 3-deoxy-7-phosphoheptulonate synthase [Umezakia ovalisporum CobakiLakeA]
MHDKLFNTNIKNSHVLLTPNEVKLKLPLTKLAEHTVLQYRQEIKNILDFQDRRKFIVVGPCSIHDTQAAMEYSHRLKVLAERVKDKLLLVMRVYFEKPRTTVGWKGLINDPDMNDSFHVEKGLLTARSLLIRIAELGLPAGTEALDPIIPQYLSELITWSAIGARTTESQTHREMASGLSMPVGFKNGTDGNIQVALNALESAKSSHNFLGINHKGQVSVFETRGNAYGHVILRGGGQPNYEAEYVRLVEEKLKAANLPPRIVIDCSHGNTNKDYKLQPIVLENVIQQIVDGNTSVVGVMLESNLYEGNQPMTGKREELKYGVSVTDKCISWDETEKIILAAYEKLS